MDQPSEKLGGLVGNLPVDEDKLVTHIENIKKSEKDKKEFEQIVKEWDH